MKKIKEILQLKFRTDISYRQIGRAVNVPHSTVADYCRRFRTTNYAIDEFLKFDEDEIYQLLFPERRLPNRQKDRPLPDFAYIHKEIGKKDVTFELL